MKHFRVGRYEKLFIFFWKAIKIAGSAQKIRVGRVSGNTGIFLGLTVAMKVSHFRCSVEFQGLTE